MAIHVDYVLNLTDLPDECILDCGEGPGQKDAAVNHWRDALNFTVDRAKAIDCIAGYGAWEREDLENREDDDLAEIILWLACGNFAEYIFECQNHKPPIDPRGERPDGFDPSAGSDIFVLE